MTFTECEEYLKTVIPSDRYWSMAYEVGHFKGCPIDPPCRLYISGLHGLSSVSVGAYTWAEVLERFTRELEERNHTPKTDPPPDIDLDSDPPSVRAGFRAKAIK